MAGGKARKLYHDFRSDADDRYQDVRHQENIRGLAGIAGQFLGTKIAENKQNQQNSALLGFLQQQAGGGGAAPGTIAPGAPTAGGMPAAGTLPAQGGAQTNPLIGFLLQNPDIARGELGQSLIQNQVQQQFEPTIDVPGIGRVPRNAAGIQAWSAAQARTDAASQAQQQRAHELAKQRNEYVLEDEFNPPIDVPGIGKVRGGPAAINAVASLRVSDEANERARLNRENDLTLAANGDASALERLREEYGLRAEEAVIKHRNAMAEGTADTAGQIEVAKEKARLEASNKLLGGGRSSSGSGDGADGGGADWRDVRDEAEALREKLRELEGVGYKEDPGSGAISERDPAEVKIIRGSRAAEIEELRRQIVMKDQEARRLQPAALQNENILVQALRGLREMAARNAALQYRPERDDAIRRAMGGP